MFNQNEIALTGNARALKIISKNAKRVSSPNAINCTDSQHSTCQIPSTTARWKVASPISILAAMRSVNAPQLSCRSFLKYLIFPRKLPLPFYESLDCEEAMPRGTRPGIWPFNHSAHLFYPLLAPWIVGCFFFLPSETVRASPRIMHCFLHKLFSRSVEQCSPISTSSHVLRKIQSVDVPLVARELSYAHIRSASLDIIVSLALRQ